MGKKPPPPKPKRNEPQCSQCSDEADGIHEGVLYCSRHLPPPNPIGQPR